MTAACSKEEGRRRGGNWPGRDGGRRRNVGGLKGTWEERKAWGRKGGQSPLDKHFFCKS